MRKSIIVGVLSSLLLMSILNSSVALPAKAARSVTIIPTASEPALTLIDLIRKSLTQINPDNSLEEFYAGMVFGIAGMNEFNTLCNMLMTNAQNAPTDTYDNLTIKSQYMAQICLLHYLAKELDYFNETAIKYCLDNLPTTSDGATATYPPLELHNGTPTYLPGTWHSRVDGKDFGPDYGFIVHDTYTLILYLYAQILNYRLDKWNYQAAYQNFKASCGWSGDFPSYGIISTNGVESYNNRHRWYDETLETARCLAEFYIRYGMTDALDAAVNMAETVTGLGVRNGTFRYSVPGWASWECETPGIWVELSKINALKGFQTNYMTIIDSDIYTKYLASYWNSPMWNNYVCRHSYPAETSGMNNPEQRLQNTAMIALGMHAYYHWLSSTSKGIIRTMLQQWPDGITANRDIYDATSGKFALTGGSTKTAAATACGLMILALSGIVPDTSNLIVPLSNEVGYESWFWLRPDIFQFDLANNKLVIAVSAGTMNLNFGTSLTSITFPESGVYEISFNDSAWNSLIDFPSRVSDIPSDIYASDIAPIISPPIFPRKLTVDCVLDGFSTTVSGTIEATTPTAGQFQGPFSHDFENGTVVTINAFANSGYTFVGWALDGTMIAPVSNTIAVTMDTTHILKATFAALRTLHIQQPANGTTTPKPGKYEYSDGATETVTAVPDLGYELEYWILDDAPSGKQNPINVTMNINHTLTAAFMVSTTPARRSDVLPVLLAVGGAGVAFIGGFLLLRRDKNKKKQYR